MKHGHLPDCRGTPIDINEETISVGTWVIDGEEYPVNVHIMRKTTFMDYIRTEHYHRITVDSERCHLHDNNETWYSVVAYDGKTAGEIGIAITFMDEMTFRAECRHFMNVSVWDNSAERIQFARDVQAYNDGHKVSMAKVAPFFNLKKLITETPCQCHSRIRDIATDPSMMYYTLVDHIVPYILSDNPAPNKAVPLNLCYYLRNVRNYARTMDGDVIHVTPQALNLIETELEYSRNAKTPSQAYLDQTQLNKCRRVLDESEGDMIIIPKLFVDANEATPNVSAETLVYSNVDNSELDRNISQTSDSADDEMRYLPDRVLAGLNDSIVESADDSDSDECILMDPVKLGKWLRRQGQLEHLSGFGFKVFTGDSFIASAQKKFYDSAYQTAWQVEDEEQAKTRGWVGYFTTRGSELIQVARKTIRPTATPKPQSPINAHINAFVNRKIEMGIKSCEVHEDAVLNSDPTWRSTHGRGAPIMSTTNAVLLTSWAVGLIPSEVLTVKNVYDYMTDDSTEMRRKILSAHYENIRMEAIRKQTLEEWNAQLVMLAKIGEGVSGDNKRPQRPARNTKKPKGKHVELRFQDESEAGKLSKTEKRKIEQKAKREECEYERKAINRDVSEMLNADRRLKNRANVLEKQVNAGKITKEEACERLEKKQQEEYPTLASVDKIAEPATGPNKKEHGPSTAEDSSSEAEESMTSYHSRAARRVKRAPATVRRELSPELSFGAAVKINPYWSSKSNTNDKNLENVIVFQHKKAIYTERPVKCSTPEVVETTPTVHDRLRIAKGCFSRAQKCSDYMLVSMPNGYCMPFAMVCSGLGWPEDAKHTTDIQHCIPILTEIAEKTPYEPWITNITGTTGHICLAMSFSTYYNALSQFANVTGDGVYINREKLSEAKSDQWTYDKHAGFQLTINGNASDTLLETIARDGANIKIQDKTRNVKLMAHGGHQTARRLVDIVHVSNWNQVLTAVCTGKYERIIDVGSKFASMRSRLVRASLSYVAETPDYKITFKPHRMEDSDYNRLYLRENLESYREKIRAQPEATICYQGKFINIVFEDVCTDEVNLDNTNEDDIVVMTDAHYYNLSNPMHGLKCYSGLSFPGVAGIYRYGEELIIRVIGTDTGSKIEMISNSNPTSYNHPNVNVRHASKIISWEELTFIYGQTTDPEFVVNVKLSSATNLVDWKLEKLRRNNDTDAKLIIACRVENIDISQARSYKPTYQNYGDWWRRNDACFSNRSLACSEKLSGLRYFKYLELPSHVRYRFSVPTKRQWKWASICAAVVGLVVLASNFKAFTCEPWFYGLLHHTLQKKDTWLFRLALASSSFLASTLGGLLACFGYNHMTNTIKAATHDTPYIISEAQLQNLGITIGCLPTTSPKYVESPAAFSYEHLIQKETEHDRGTRPIFEEHEDDLKSALAGVVDLGDIQSKQNLKLRRGANTNLKVEKPCKNFEYNNKLVELDLNLVKAHELYERSKSEAQKPAASFVYHDDEGNPYSQHCWDSRSMVNLFYAFFDRQVGTMLKPEVNVVEHFKLFCQAQIAEIHKVPVKHVSKSFSLWLREHQDWSLSKKLFYKENYKLQMRDAYPEGYFKNRFDITVKNLEMYYCAMTEIDQCVVSGLKDRPRSIMTPHESLCGVITYAQHIVFEMLKRNYSEFVHGENSKDFWDRTYPEIHRKLRHPVAFSLDGGSHDSHQHSSLIQAVDHQIWQHFKPEITQLLVEQGAANVDRLVRDIYRVLLSTKARIDFRHRREHLGHAVVDGTVFSGSPTLTTLGNTMRVIYYYKFMLHHADIHEYVLRVAGDDAVIWLEQDKADMFEDALQCFTSSTKLPQSKGLGQMLEYTRTPGHVAEFCSKMLVCDPTNYSTGQWVRKPQSLLFKGLTYKGRQPIFEDPGVYSYVWGSCLATESQGPIYREYASLRMKMGEKTTAQLHKKQAILCKNEYELTLDPWYIANFSFWYGCSEDQTLRFLTLLQQLDSLPKVELGLSLPRPDEL